MGMPTVNSVGAIESLAAGITVNPGASHTVNDIDILLIQTSGGATTLTTPAGFAEITALTQVTGAETTGARMTVFWRRWNGTDGSPTTNDAGNMQAGRMISISGCKTSGDPWNVIGTGTTDAVADTSVSAAGATTTAPDCLVLAMCAQKGPDATTTTEFGAATNGDLVNLTERMDNSVTAGSGGALWMVSGEKASAGAYGATTCTAVTSAVRVCGSIALEGVSAGTTVTPAVIPTTSTIPTPTVLAASLVEPAAVATVTTVPTPTVLAGALVQPGVIATVSAVPTPTVLAAAIVAPAVIATVSTVPTPVIDVSGGAVTVQPAVIATATTIPTPTVLAAALIQPAVIATGTTVPTPTVLAGALTQPTVIATTTTIPTPTVQAASTVTPVTVSTSVTVPTPTITAGAMSAPATIVTTVGVPTPTIIAGALTQPATITTVSTVPTPTVVTGAIFVFSPPGDAVIIDFDRDGTIGNANRNGALSAADRKGTIRI